MDKQREPLIDRIERFIFGASAPEAVEMRLRLAEQRLLERLEQAWPEEAEEVTSPDADTAGEA